MPIEPTSSLRGYDGLSFQTVKLTTDHNDSLPLTFTAPASILDASSSKLPHVIRIIRNVSAVDVTGITIQSEKGDVIPCPLKAGEAHSYCSILAVAGIPDATSIVGYR